MQKSETPGHLFRVSLLMEVPAVTGQSIGFVPDARFDPKRETAGGLLFGPLTWQSGLFSRMLGAASSYIEAKQWEDVS